MRLNVPSGSVRGITGFLPKESKYHYKNYITVKLIQCTIQIYNDPH